MTTMPDEPIQNSTSPSFNPSHPTNVRQFATNGGGSATHTSPVITDLEESDHHSKDMISPNPSTGASVLHLHQPNNNNNSIYGYVTQQQLANFGTNVALAKELNT